MARCARQLITANRDPPDSSEPMLSTDPTDSTDAADPTLPMLSTDPTEPIDSSDWVEPMDRALLRER